MKAYKGVFKKKDGSTRHMVFARIDDLPQKFVATKILGAGQEQKYPNGMELVWDLEADSFRVFNHNTKEQVKELNIDESLFT
tara:strand:+ start:2184 stop:2429 length:246 start_codon:yes stop_codon:yes gene_type:complete